MKQIYVVEGKNDIHKLKEVYSDINAISVNGSEIDEEVITYLLKIKKDYEIIIITDPDFPGLKIRNELEERLGEVSHIFLDRSKSFSKNKKKIGLEHLSNKEVERVLSKVYRPNKSEDNIFNLNMLFEYKLIGDINSKSLREFISNDLNLGYVNGKRLLKRLNESNVSIKELENSINKYNEIK